MRLGPFLLASFLVLALGSAQAAGTTTNKTTGKKSTATAPKTSKPAAKSTAKPKSKAAAKSAAKSTTKSTAKAPARKGGTACKPAKGRKSCAAAVATPAAKTYTSPISADSLEKKNAAQAGDELKARTVPERAYAIDGQTFFHQGRRIRIEGLSSASATATGEHAKQRLQTILDSGSLAIDQIAIDDTGIATAQVRVNGRDLATVLNGN